MQNAYLENSVVLQSGLDFSLFFYFHLFKEWLNKMFNIFYLNFPICQMVLIPSALAGISHPKILLWGVQRENSTSTACPWHYSHHLWPVQSHTLCQTIALLLISISFVQRPFHSEWMRRSPFCIYNSHFQAKNEKEVSFTRGWACLEDLNIVSLL